MTTADRDAAYASCREALRVAEPLLRKVAHNWNERRRGQQACFFVVHSESTVGTKARDVHDLIPWPGPPTSDTGYRAMATPPDVMRRIWLLAMHGSSDAVYAWAATMEESAGNPICLVLVDDHSAIFVFDSVAATLGMINSPGGIS